MAVACSCTSTDCSHHAQQGWELHAEEYARWWMFGVWADCGEMRCAKEEGAAGPTARCEAQSHETACRRLRASNGVRGGYLRRFDI